MKWFDFHCDTLTVCEEQGLPMRSNARTQLDFVRLRQAGAYAQCFAVFLDQDAFKKQGISAWRRYEQLRDHFYAELQNNRDAVRQVRTAQELAEAERDGVTGAILTVEGGELLSGETFAEEQAPVGVAQASAAGAQTSVAGAQAFTAGAQTSVAGAQVSTVRAQASTAGAQVFIGTEISAGEGVHEEKGAGSLHNAGGRISSGEIDILRARLARMWEDGVRLLTLTWNHENVLGYPNGSAGGLKQAGYEAVAFMQELGMLVDVSHLSDRGFWDVMDSAKKPVIASHSCARSLCGHPRNLTDAQLKAIGENGGVVGVNFHAPFLKENGVSGSIQDVVYHLRHIISCAGSEAAAFGSDYDGMRGTPEWGGCEGMPRLIEALSGYFDADTMEKICYRNAERLL
ncbi:MAG: dipeptidase [bacterium]|nr:dipeptidase [bacterium]